MTVKIGKYTIAKECGGRLFPGVGRGYWDGLYYYIFRSKKINLKFRKLNNRYDNTVDGFAFGPLMVWWEK